MTHGQDYLKKWSDEAPHPNRLQTVFQKEAGRASQKTEFCCGERAGDPRKGRVYAMK